ncbi:MULTISPECIES: hypothetical protein [Paenibacillus]|uniref:Uncharacterized protein n=1 Tax=Paenibacillus radicis (ex Xue et al. 2023) TaxID=2972489 RepID=A0ABT1YL46_9BACL|nr:hypothetical protein [Paenibacillus radicis (ex Xue et al. 2023)]MCR8633894.1 hypothetical protein [Paenibacillus radicis (ex Xue et al. 2023)]
MDDIAAREDLRLKLIEAEAVLKEAEEEYAVFLKQLEHYRMAIKVQKEKILMIKQRSGLHIQ